MKSIQFFVLGVIFSSVIFLGIGRIPNFSEQTEEDRRGQTVVHDRKKQIIREGIREIDLDNPRSGRQLTIDINPAELDYTNLEEIRSVFQSLKDLPTGIEKRNQMALFASTLGRVPADFALALLSDIQDDLVYNAGVFAVVKQLTKSSPEQAVTLLKENWTSSHFAQGKQFFIQNQRNSPEGLERIKNLFVGASSQEKQGLVNSLRNSEDIGTQEYVTELINDGFSDARFGTSRYSKLVRSGLDEKKALEMIGRIKAPDLLVHEKQKFFEFLTEKDPISATSSLQLLTNEEAIDIVPNVVKIWFDASPEEVGKWVDSLEPGIVKDAAIRGLIRELDATDSRAIDEWREELSDTRED